MTKRPHGILLQISSMLITGALMGASAYAAETTNAKPSAGERAAAKAGNEIDEAVGQARPVTEAELKSSVSLDGIKNPAQALATAQIKNKQGQAIGTVSSVDVSPDGKAKAIHADVGGFLGLGEHRVAIQAKSFVYLKSRNLLVISMTKDEIKALTPEIPPHR